MTPIDTLGDYELLEQIAAGGMAKTFRVRRISQPESELLCLKVMHHNLGEDEDFVKMIIDEARIAESLVHPNIVRVYEFGQASGRYFIAMELIEGRDLKQILERAARLGTRMTPAMVAVTVRDICRALHYVHTKRLNGKPLNIVHRDISPHNVILNWKGQPKLTDFGIAKAAGRLTHTRTGAVKGKCGYMSPEQARGGEIDARSDVFSVGILMHEMLTGRRLFAADSNFQAFSMILEDPIPPPSMFINGLDQELELICFRALERSQDNRYASAGDMRRDLDDWITRHVGPPQKAGVAEYLGTLFGLRDGALPAAELPMSEEIAALASLSTNIFDAASGAPSLPANLSADELQPLPARPSDHTAVINPREDESEPGSSTVQMDRSALVLGATGVFIDDGESFGSTVQLDREALAWGASQLNPEDLHTATDHEHLNSGPQLASSVPSIKRPEDRPRAPASPRLAVADPPPDYSVVGATMTVDGDMIVEEELHRPAFGDVADEVGTTIEVDFSGIDFSRPPGAGGLPGLRPPSGSPNGQAGVQLSPSLELERLEDRRTPAAEPRRFDELDSFNDEDDATLRAPRLVPEELREEIERHLDADEPPAPRISAGIQRLQRPPRPAPRPIPAPSKPPAPAPAPPPAEDDEPEATNPTLWRGLMIGILVVMLLGTCTVGVVGVVVVDRLSKSPNGADPLAADPHPDATVDGGLDPSSDTDLPRQDAGAGGVADKGDDDKPDDDKPDDDKPDSDKGVADKGDSDKPGEVAHKDAPPDKDNSPPASDAPDDEAIARKRAEEQERQKKLAEERRQKWLKERATLVFTAKPGAKVFIDGKRVGQTPLKKQVKAGTYDIRFNNDELKRARFFNKVTVKAGETKTINYSFQ